MTHYGQVDSQHIREELFLLTSVLDTTTWSDILNKLLEFMDFGDGRKLDLNKKLFSVIMNGATAMLGTNVGFIELLETEIGHHIWSFPCKIHEESLCAKASARQLNEIECYGEYHKYNYGTFSLNTQAG